MLHITNGDSTLEQIRLAGIDGELCAWRDALHEGPVPAGLSLEALREGRSRYIAAQGWGNQETVLDDFARRDEMLEAFRTHDEVVLWFECDLYDQLQLIQILDWLHGRDHANTRVSLVCVQDYLGAISSGPLKSHFDSRQPIAREELETGQKAWNAVRSPDPTEIEKVIQRGTPALPFLRDALVRHLQEFPSLDHGLSLSEERLLRAIASGRSVLHEAFVASHHEQEEHIFLGDIVFAAFLQRLSLVERPLVLFEDGGRIIVPRDPSAREVFWTKRAVLTDMGKDILEGKFDHVYLNGIDRWRGGVYLNGRGSVWRWDADHSSLLFQ